jgi:hypothetical protein
MSDLSEEDLDVRADWLRNPGTQTFIAQVKASRKAALRGLLAQAKSSSDPRVAASVERILMFDELLVTLGGKRLAEDRGENGET